MCYFILALLIQTMGSIKILKDFKDDEDEDTDQIKEYIDIVC